MSASLPPPLPARLPRLIAGMVAGNLAGLLQFLGVLAAAKEYFPGFQVLSLGATSFLFVAFTAGFVAAWVWKPLSLTMGRSALHSLTATAMGLAGAMVFLGEGHICVLMAAPFQYFLFAAGAEVGRRWFRRDDRMRLTAMPLLFVLAAAESGTASSHSGIVVDEITIAAPPAKVWPHVLAFDGIAESPDFWLFRLGLPYPVATTNAGNFVGAERSCEFSGNAVFRERVAEIVPEQRLTFDIVESPAHPELIGHLDAHRGQFLLRDNGDGTTTLVGSTWYSLHVRPAWYFDLWTHHIFRAVHLRVMRHVKRLAENGT